MRLLILILCIALTACSTNSGTDVSTDAPANVDWIDVDLTPDTFSESSTQYREGDYEIELSAFSALEFKLGLSEGDLMVYSWTVEMTDPDLLGVEFHGHTERIGSEPGTVMFYKIHNDGEESGILKAPFSGIHGWYLNNQGDEDIIVRLHAAGFYTEL